MSETDTGPRSKQELRTALTELLNDANRNGVTVSGGWKIADESREEKWDLVITSIDPRTNR